MSTSPTTDVVEHVPDAARLLRDFVNTAEPQTGGEELRDAAALTAWCRGHGLVPPGAALGPDDVATAVAMREGLRAVLQAHAGHPAEHVAEHAAEHPADDEAAPALDAVLASVPLRATLDPLEGLRLRPGREAPVDALVAGLVDAVRRAGADGSWDRLKVCARDSCRWAFYDTSRNRSGRWCSMAGCGNLVKMRRAHARRRQAGPPPPA